MTNETLSRRVAELHKSFYPHLFKQRISPLSWSPPFSAATERVMSPHTCLLTTFESRAKVGYHFLLLCNGMAITKLISTNDTAGTFTTFRLPQQMRYGVKTPQAPATMYKHGARTLMSFCMQIMFASDMVSAYLSRLRMMITSGKHSRLRWGPGEGCNNGERGGGDSPRVVRPSSGSLFRGSAPNFSIIFLRLPLCVVFNLREELRCNNEFRLLLIVSTLDLQIYRFPEAKTNLEQSFMHVPEAEGTVDKMKPNTNSGRELAA